MRSRSKWRRFPRRNGKTMTMGGRCGVTRGLNIDVKVWDKDRSYRALYTRPKYDEGQQLLEFVRPDNILVTNLDQAHDALKKMVPELQKYWLEDETIIFHHHQ